MAHIMVKRVYEPPAASDGQRILVDRVWPRGMTKDAAHVAAWMRDVAPSTELRRWFGHDPARWDQFRRRYHDELSHEPAALAPLLDAAREGPVTLVYSARDEQHNQAVALKEFLDEQLHDATAQ